MTGAVDRAEAGQHSTNWLTIEEAAKRVGRSERTIYRWAADDLLRILLGRVIEQQLLDVDKAMRGRRGRPRKGPMPNAVGVMGLTIVFPPNMIATITGGDTVTITPKKRADK